MPENVTRLAQQQSVLMMHLLNGEPQGPRTLELTHTNTKAIAVPRKEYERVSRAQGEFGRPGCYILVFDPSIGSSLTEKVYIGQADVGRIRLDQHARDAEMDWVWLVLFTSKDGRMNNAHAQHIEARLVAMARGIGRAELVNMVNPEEPTLDPADRVMAERFLSDILVYCPILGLNAFSIPRAPTTAGQQVGEPEAQPTSTGVPTIPIKTTLALWVSKTPAATYHLNNLPEAHGYNTEDGFVVLSGSPLRPHVTESADEWHGVSKIRDQLLSTGVLVKDGEVLRFARDYVFTSPSRAAYVVIGYSTSGRTAWVTEEGVTLNEVEAGRLTRDGGQTSS